jgi:hypothetical protein
MGLKCLKLAQSGIKGLKRSLRLLLTISSIRLMAMRYYPVPKALSWDISITIIFKTIIMSKSRMIMANRIILKIVVNLDSFKYSYIVIF